MCRSWKQTDLSKVLGLGNLERQDSVAIIKHKNSYRTQVADQRFDLNKCCYIRLRPIMNIMFNYRMAAAQEM